MLLLLYLVGIYHPNIGIYAPLNIDPLHCDVYVGNGQPDKVWDEGYTGEGLYCVELEPE